MLHEKPEEDGYGIQPHKERVRGFIQQPCLQHHQIYFWAPCTHAAPGQIPGMRPIGWEEEKRAGATPPIEKLQVAESAISEAAAYGWRCT